MPEQTPHTPTERDLQRTLAHDAIGRGQRLIVPNSYVYDWESDLLSVSRAGYVSEYEIKLSYSDFERDFEKTAKHDWLKKHKTPGPNYFYYACPPGLLHSEDLPRHQGRLYCGLLYVSPGRVDRIIKAPRLHTQSMDQRVERYLERGLDARFWEIA